MYRSSVDAVLRFLQNNFPLVENICINEVPQGFNRPGFLIELSKSSSKNVNRKMYENNTAWKIVYFAPKGDDGTVDAINQLEVLDTLNAKLMVNMILTDSEGVIYHIEDCETGSRDTEVYCIVKLLSEAARPEPQSDTMQIIEHQFKEG